MEARIVRFSRPLLLRVCDYKDDYFYQTIYGFWLPERVDLTDPIDEMRMEQYMGYLAGLHIWSSGFGTEDGFFTIKGGRWVDETGEVHTKQDEWMTSMQIKCLLKLGLTYDIITVDVDEDEFLYSVINENLLVVNEEFYYDIEKDLIYDTPCAKGPSSEEDELPF